MKKTDLYKNLAHKTDNQLKLEKTPGRFGNAPASNRKAQRKMDQTRGLIPFAVKLESGLAAQVRAFAQARQMSVDDGVDMLLRHALNSQDLENPSTDESIK